MTRRKSQAAKPGTAPRSSQATTRSNKAARTATRARNTQVAADRTETPVVASAELARTHWQAGQWREVAAIHIEDIRDEPDRAVLAMIIAAAHSHLGDMYAARRFGVEALRWGCDRRIAARILVSVAYNSLGQIAACVGEQETSLKHFESYTLLVDGRADTAAARRRQVQALGRIGLLAEALGALEAELNAARQQPQEKSAQLKILAVEIQLLKEELRVAIQRGQIYRPFEEALPVHANDGIDIERLNFAATSQLGQDLWVLRRTGYKRGGFFVEFGAMDGLSLSNSWLLETEFGWRGLCAEPNPDLFERLHKNRRCIVSSECIGPATGQEVEFILADAFGTISSYADADMHADTRKPYSDDGRTIRLRTTSLDDFLRRHSAPREIDYLSIDTEGSEFDILNAFPFSEWKVRLLTVEHNFTPQREKIRELLERHGYRRTIAKWDDWYELER